MDEVERLRITVIELLKMLHRFDDENFDGNDQRMIMDAMYQVGILHDPFRSLRTELQEKRNGGVKGAYSTDEVRALLREKALEFGTQASLAAACGVSDQFLSDIVLGKREPSGKPLEFLGLRRAVRYEVLPMDTPLTAECRKQSIDAERYRWLRKFLSAKDLLILLHRGERDEPDERLAIDMAVDSARAAAPKPDAAK